jgi:hypothetical protein
MHDHMNVKNYKITFNLSIKHGTTKNSGFEFLLFWPYINAYFWIKKLDQHFFKHK